MEVTVRCAESFEMECGNTESVYAVCSRLKDASGNLLESVSSGSVSVSSSSRTV